MNGPTGFAFALQGRYGLKIIVILGGDAVDLKDTIENYFDGSTISGYVYERPKVRLLLKMIEKI